MEAQLISLQDIKDICINVSSNLREDKLVNSEILSSQRMDLGRLLGEALYLDFASNATTEQEYIDLLNGVDFTNCEGDTVRHYGLRYAIAWRSFVRMLVPAGTHLTRSGAKVQRGDNSEKEVAAILVQEQTRGISKAVYYENIALEYLTQNRELYPLFKCSTQTAGTGITFRRLRKNKTNRIY